LFLAPLVRRNSSVSSRGSNRSAAENSAVSHREEGKPSERLRRATGVDDRLRRRAGNLCRRVDDRHPHPRMVCEASEASNEGLFSECVDSQFVQTSDRRHEFPLPRVGIDDESDQVP